LLPGLKGTASFFYLRSALCLLRAHQYNIAEFIFQPTADARAQRVFKVSITAPAGRIANIVCGDIPIVSEATAEREAGAWIWASRPDLPWETTHKAPPPPPSGYTLLLRTIALRFIDATDPLTSRRRHYG
jgi:hypothetical protein